MASYLTPPEAHDILADFEIDAYPSLGALEAASLRLDSLGPWYGARRATGQALAFPRTYLRDGDVDNEVPRAIKIWVALEAHKFTLSQGGGDKPGVTSISHPAAGSVTYSRPKVAVEAALQQGLLGPYQVRTGLLR